MRYINRWLADSNARIGIKILRIIRISNTALPHGGQMKPKIMMKAITNYKWPVNKQECISNGLKLLNRQKHEIGDK